MMVCSNTGSLACFSCGFPWWMKPVDGCWIRIWCNGYAQKLLLWIFLHLGHFIDFLELWTAIFGKNPKKRIFSHLHCYLCYGEVITLESGFWRHRETTGMAQSTLRCALGDFSNSGNPRKWGWTPESQQKFFKVVCIYVVDPFWHFCKVWQWYVLRFTNFNGEIIIETSKRDFFRRFWGL